MTKKILLDMLIDIAIDYTKTAKDSLLRNNHMNALTKEEFDTLTQNQIDAIIVDFINVVGNYQGIDLGLYVEDLYDIDERVK